MHENLIDSSRRQIPEGASVPREHSVAGSQYEYDEPHPGAPPWRKIKVEVLPLWEPAVGDTVNGEFSGRNGDDGGDWHAISAGVTINLRVGPQVDQPVKIVTLNFSKSLRELEPLLGTALCIQRVKDKPRWKMRRWHTEEPLMEQAFMVSVVKVEDVEDEELPPPQGDPITDEVF